MTQTYYTNEITLNGEKIIIPFVPVKEFLKFGEAPYVFCGSTGAGKTIFSVDILHQFAKSANYIYYVTQTKPNFSPNDPIKQIPNIFIRDPGENTYETIKNIWEDIKARVDSMKMTPDEMRIILDKLYKGKLMEKIDKYLMEKNLKPIEYTACEIEIISRLILDKCLHNPNSMTSLTDVEKSHVNSMISHSTKTILILDDLSTLITQAQNAKQTTLVNGSALKVGAAFQTLLIDILTRGRHYNCICCLFIHSLKTTLDQSVIKNIQNFVMVDQSALKEIAGMTSIGLKPLLDVITTQIDIFNPNKYKYYVLYTKRDGKIAKITKARLHTGEPIELNDFVKRFNKFIDDLTVSDKDSQNIMSEEINLNDLDDLI